MKTAAVSLLAVLGYAQAFVVPSAVSSHSLATRSSAAPLRMGLNAELTKTFPRDFTKIPTGTDYGTGVDAELNKREEEARIQYLEDSMMASLKKMMEVKTKPMFTTALIAGDCVILDALAKAQLLDRVDVVFIDTYFLFPESLEFLRELEAHYGFKAKVYHAADCATQEEFYEKYGEDYWMEDIDQYDLKCKVEPLQRALREAETDAWINGRRRDHGFERAALPVWEGNKVNPLAFWTFEDCWTYLRKHKVPYHPLHDVGFSSLGDMQSTRKVPLDKWFTYGGERSGRFEGLKNKDGSNKTECGIHTEIKT
ncbi:Phosphoadenylyl-sulfate reductase [Tribonema minus]|uniref:Phosphoadenylyl-sulfate reductase n=1 Tax=Tribonema minus TaxID=303371 RepID=A0A835Z3Q9_9STRA|nr:Phosphoadenylyl-sulfate reductase [Tribonema minus]